MGEGGVKNPKKKIADVVYGWSHSDLASNFVTKSFLEQNVVYFKPQGHVHK